MELTRPWPAAAALREVLRQAWLGLGAVFLLTSVAIAQVATVPADVRETRLIVPVEPGGGIDTVARLVAQHWSTSLQKTVNVFNRPGASGNLGTASVARAQPDGQTLLVTGVSHLSSPLLHSAPGFDPIADFVGVARLATAPNVLVVSDALKDFSLKQILQDLRSTNEGFTFSSAGYGHTSHIAAEVFMARTGVRWLHVPYKGTAPALRALMAGEVQIMFVPAASVGAAVRSGRVHALAVAHPVRISLLPDTPTLRELGVLNAEFSQWYGILAPRGTPSEQLRTLSAWSDQTVQSPLFAAWVKAQGMEPGFLNQEQFGDFLVSEQRRLDALLKKERVERPVN